MNPDFFRKYADIIAENEQEYSFELDEVAPPGKEAWVRKNKQRFIDQYGPDKGLSILYATAWRDHNQHKHEDTEYSSAKPMNEKHIGFAKLEKQIDKNPKVDNPAAVAAAIGRKKYGQAGMTKRSIAGRS